VFSWRALLEDAYVIREDSTIGIDDLLNGLRQKRVRIEGQAYANNPLRFPQRLDDFGPLRDVAIQLAADLGDEAAYLYLRELMVNPQRVIVLESEQDIPDVSLRRVALMSALRIGADTRLVVATLRIRQSSGKFGRVVIDDCVFEFRRPGEVDRLNAIAEQLYLSAEPAARAWMPPGQRRPATVFWIGGSTGEIADLDRQWRQRIEAVARARGFLVEVVERPYDHVQGLIRAVGDTDPVAILAWGPYSHGAEFNQRLVRRQIMVIDEPSLEDALIAARLQLDELADARFNAVEQGDEEPEFQPATWIEFHDNLALLESPAFVLTGNAKEGCLRTGYADPGRMWHHLAQLARAANEWARRECRVGQPLDDWIRANFGIEISLHDQGLGDRVEFTFEDRIRSREPHVKVDDFKAPDECGRIYFAYDSGERRFIVDHIGLHL